MVVGGGGRGGLLKLISRLRLNIIAEREPYCQLLSHSSGLPVVDAAAEFSSPLFSLKTLICMAILNSGAKYF